MYRLPEIPGSSRRENSQITGRPVDSPEQSLVTMLFVVSSITQGLAVSGSPEPRIRTMIITGAYSGDFDTIREADSESLFRRFICGVTSAISV